MNATKNIIGAPPERKRGAVLSPLAAYVLDYVTRHNAFAHDIIGEVQRERDEQPHEIRRAILELSRAGAIKIGEGWAVAPAEPEPGPAVTTRSRGCSGPDVDPLGRFARAAVTGCVGTGERRLAGFDWYYPSHADSHRPGCCTADEALRGEVC